MLHSEYKAVVERQGTVLVKVPKVNPDSEVVEIKIPDDPEVAVTRPLNKLFQTKSPDFDRWAAGGFGYSIGGCMTFFMRDEGAPTYAGHLTSSTGLSGTPEEWLDPLSLAIREGTEELIIANSSRGMVVPQLEGNGVEQINLHIQTIAKSNQQTLLHFRPDIPPLSENIPMSFMDMPNEREIKIQWRDQESRQKGLINFDPGVNGIDFLKVAELDSSIFYLRGIVVHAESEGGFSHPSIGIKDDFVLLDGEATGGGKFLNRKVYVINLGSFKQWKTAGFGSDHLLEPLLIFQGGQRLPIEPVRALFTPVSMEIIKAVLSKLEAQ